MYVSPESIHPQSHVWVYFSEKPFSDVQLAGITNDLRQFCESWNVHGHPLPSSFEIRYNQFIILMADETAMHASGCSIDSSVRAVKQLEATHGVNLFNRTLVPFLKDGSVITTDLSKLKVFFTEGILQPRDLTFNNMVSSKEELDRNWILAAEQTWVRRYLPEVAKS